MQLELREKKYFDERATREMEQHLHSSKRTVQGSLAYATRILAMTGHEAGLAGQLTARSERPKCYWTLHFGLGFDEATPEDFIEVDADLKTVRASGSDQEAAEVERRLAANPELQCAVMKRPVLLAKPSFVPNSMS